MSPTEQNSTQTRAVPEVLNLNIPVNLPTYYCNKILVGSSFLDIQLTSVFNNRATSQTVMPLTVAKSLLAALEKALKDVEDKTNQKIENSNDIIKLVRSKK